MTQLATAFRTNEEEPLGEMRLRLLAAAPIMMDQRLLGEVGPTAAGAGLIDIQPRRAAFAAGVSAHEVMPVQQAQRSKRFEFSPRSSRGSEKRVLHDERIVGNKCGFRGRVA
ncbi:hypothetical protein DB459_15660 [Bradyrhizobium sp. WD16]|nr:hypothetical protein DB459_15660 [Bradyrhizobium sp. WD16]